MKEMPFTQVCEVSRPVGFSGIIYHLVARQGSPFHLLKGLPLPCVFGSFPSGR